MRLESEEYEEQPEHKYPLGAVPYDGDDMVTVLDGESDEVPGHFASTAKDKKSHTRLMGRHRKEQAYRGEGKWSRLSERELDGEGWMTSTGGSGSILITLPAAWRMMWLSSLLLPPMVARVEDWE